MEFIKRVSIRIDERTEDIEDMKRLLEYIARQLESGMTSGIDPTWDIVYED